jgi:hypothetical protein
MKSRCLNQNHRSFPDYGGRGIAVCERWRRSFANFLADVGPRPSARHSIERIRNDENYQPGNVRWAIPVEQQNNRRCTIFVIAYPLDRMASRRARTDVGKKVGEATPPSFANGDAAATIIRKGAMVLI